MYRPEEYIKHLRVEMHPTTLQQWYCADVPREVAACGARLVSCGEICDPALVVWTRRVPYQHVATSSKVQLPSDETCDHALYLMCTAAAFRHVKKNSLAGHMNVVKDMAGCTVTLVILGLRDYLKLLKNRTATSNDGFREEPLLVKLLASVTDTLVGAGVDTVVVNQAHQLALLIAQFTKAIAKLPFSNARKIFDEQAEYYMRGDKRNAIAVDKDGNGVARLWQQMIAVLPRSSLEISRAVCEKYKSPRDFIEAMESPTSENELANIKVTRAGVPGSKERRVGPEFARKLHMLFTCEDGDMLLE